MARTSEPAFNAYLAEALRRRHPLWEAALGSEQTGVLKDGGKRPDIVIDHPGGLPVVVETEFMPARTVERDALARLGGKLARSGVAVEQAVAVQVPSRLREGQENIDARIGAQGFCYCAWSSSPAGPERWPESGWLEGGIDDLATCIELATLSESRIARGAALLEEGVRQAANILRDRSLALHPNTVGTIAKHLRQRDGAQTTRMAVAIIANALCFHAALSGAHGIPSLAALRQTPLGRIRQRDLLECWGRILEINYWPIFEIASRLFAAVPDAAAQQVLARLDRLVGDLSDAGTATLHDLSGRMFQRLIVDRKFLATFYTLPSSSALLAELAVPRLAADWSRADDVAGLRIADLACGTGALLAAAYSAVRSRHRRAGGDDGALHGAMMENALAAADIMPAATHLTASILSSAHPSRTFSRTRIATMPYGEQPRATGRGTAIGSLDLIEDEAAWSLFGTGGRQVRGTGGDREDDEHLRVAFAHESVDLVIMNPPFTRPTNHKVAEVPVPSFAGFDSSASEQRLMSRRLEEIRSRLDAPVGNGNAGLASNFVDLAHAKAAPGGVVALVLPATFLQGSSWKDARDLLEREYQDLLVVTISAAGATDLAFSADTGMAEALVVATKRGAGGRGPRADARFVSLERRPRTILEAVETARAIRSIDPRAGHGILSVAAGGRSGCHVRAPFRQTGCAGLLEPALARTAMSLGEGRLRLPRTREAPPLAVARLAALGARGALDRDINGGAAAASGLPRGPFDVVARRGAARPAYPVLWRHDAKRETALVVEPESEGRPRGGCEDRALDLWERTASRLHFNRDFRLNSQPLAACLTPERSIGGTAWPNFVAREPAWEIPLVMWANTTLGLISFWWIGTRQQQGRARITISALPELAVLDPRGLPPARAAKASALFEEFSGREFLPANEAWRDDARKDLDRAVLVEILGLPASVLEPLSVVRDQWCAEPSVHGGKDTRPR